MNRIAYKYFMYLIVLILSSYIFPQVHLEYVGAAFLAAFVLLIVNILIKPLLLLITLPVTLITFGLFSFVVNAWMIMLTDTFVGGITIKGFWISVLIAFIITIFNELLSEHNSKHKHRIV